MTQVRFPLQIDGRGRAAETDEDTHLRAMIAQVLFTRPGERVNLPDFGCGIQLLQFEPANEVLATTTQFLVQGALDRWLGDLIEVQDVQIQARDERLYVDVRYRRRGVGDPRHDRFAAPDTSA